MGKISEIKMQLRHKEWAEMVSEYQESGKKAEEWCSENGIKISTYYKRLNVLRTELIDGREKQSIVPVSVSASITVPENSADLDSENKCMKVGAQIILEIIGNSAYLRLLAALVQ